MSATTCENCGASIAATARFCPECGTRLREAPLESDVRTYGAPPAALSGLGKRLSRLRSRGRATVEAISAQSRARRDLLAIRHELERLAAERGERLRELGDAVYRNDSAGTEAARATVRGLDDRIAAKEAQMTEVAERTHEHVEQVQAQARPTELIEPPLPPDEPEPYPPAIPEPYPPPDEGTPPEPAPIPEPYPPPDEADPPRRI
jgi:zinc ribbon protein